MLKRTTVKHSWFITLQMKCTVFCVSEYCNSLLERKGESCFRQRKKLFTLTFEAGERECGAWCFFRYLKIEKINYP